MTGKATLAPPGAKVTVSVPASTSNLGPGFDCIGCAVSLRNRFEFELLPPGEEDRVEISGQWARGIPATPKNLALTTAKNFLARFGVEPPPMALHVEVDIPSARGLGSSSTAIIAGLSGANELLGAPMTRHDVLDLAVAIEGHPDNVAPALLGGLVVSAAHSQPLAWRRMPIHEAVSFIFVIPDYEVRTADARSVLPTKVSFNDAVFNSSRSPLVVLALQSGNLTGLWEIIEDRLHQPYRRPLYRGYDVLFERAHAAGADGFCVSGAGPAMLAICLHGAKNRVRDALIEGLTAIDTPGNVWEIEPDNSGASAHLEDQ